MLTINSKGIFDDFLIIWQITIESLKRNDFGLIYKIYFKELWELLASPVSLHINTTLHHPHQLKSDNPPHPSMHLCYLWVYKEFCEREFEFQLDLEPKKSKRKMSGDVVIEPTKEEEEAVSVQLQGKKLSWQKLGRNDSLDMESRTVSGHYGRDSKVNSFCFQYIYI